MINCKADALMIPDCYRCFCQLRRMQGICISIVAVLSFHPLCLADEGAGQPGWTFDRASAAVDRLDITAATIEQDFGRQGGLALQYTRSFGKHQLGVATPFFDTQLGGDLYLHAGDLVIDYGWSPFHEVSANPWVPSDFGTGFKLSIPTGSVNNSTGSGSVILAPRVGGVFHLGQSWAIAPAIEYQYAFEYESNAELLRAIGAESQFVYLSSYGLWVNLTPTYIHDLNSGQGALAGQVLVGKLFTRHLALSLSYTLEAVYGEFQQLRGFDYAHIWQLGIHLPLNYE